MDSPDEKVRTGVVTDIVFLEATGIKPGRGSRRRQGDYQSNGEGGHSGEFHQGMRVTGRANHESGGGRPVQRHQSRDCGADQKIGGRARSFNGRDIFKCRKLMQDGMDLGLSAK